MTDWFKVIKRVPTLYPFLSFDDADARGMSEDEWIHMYLHRLPAEYVAISENPIGYDYRHWQPDRVSFAEESEEEEKAPKEEPKEEEEVREPPKLNRVKGPYRGPGQPRGSPGPSSGRPRGKGKHPGTEG